MSGRLGRLERVSCLRHGRHHGQGRLIEDKTPLVAGSFEGRSQVSLLRGQRHATAIPSIDMIEIGPGRVHRSVD